jgi:hypothetical protein
MAIENCSLGILIGDNGCTVFAVADAAGSAVIYAGKTIINTVDAMTPDILNKKK